MSWVDNDRSLATRVSLLPEDLAEIHGAVRLMHAALEATQAAEPPAAWIEGECGPFSLPQLLSVYTYAMARGYFGCEEIAANAATDGCLRYLAGRQLPAAAQLRRFRRDHAALVRSSVAFLVSRILGQLDALPRLGFDPRTEAARRFNRAVVADSLEMDV
jgi:hypothetical protein